MRHVPRKTPPEKQLKKANTSLLLGLPDAVRVPRANNQMASHEKMSDEKNKITIAIPVAPLGSIVCDNLDKKENHTHSENADTSMSVIFDLDS